jgi:methylated-DNA-[protein]-cysteine S-methyltransferase
MIYTSFFDTPMGAMQAAAGEDALRGLWFIGQKYFPRDAASWTKKPDHPVFKALGPWLAAYFAGKNPGLGFSLAPEGSAFRQSVWKLLREIPYGKTTTYGAIAVALARKSPRASDAQPRLAAQAVGGAVGHNPISLIIPCHRVLGANGSLTGYAGGLEKKQALLELEKAELKPPRKR